MIEAVGIDNDSRRICPDSCRCAECRTYRNEEWRRCHLRGSRAVAPNDVAMGSYDRLARCFPGPAASVALGTFGEAGFQDMLAATPATMSHQPVADMKPTARKAQQDHVEERDTAKPNMVTEFLVTVLLAVGATADVSKIWKNTRDEVLWSGGLLPWRRSPDWLLIRVAMQLILTRRGTPHLFKAIMVHFMSHVLDSALSQGTQSDILHFGGFAR